MKKKLPEDFPVRIAQKLTLDEILSLKSWLKLHVKDRSQEIQIEMRRVGKAWNKVGEASDYIEEFLNEKNRYCGKRCDKLKDLKASNRWLERKVKVLTAALKEAKGRAAERVNPA